jgi:hypothetical protein
LESTKGSSGTFFDIHVSDIGKRNIKADCRFRVDSVGTKILKPTFNQADPSVIFKIADVGYGRFSDCQILGLMERST